MYRTVLTGLCPIPTTMFTIDDRLILALGHPVLEYSPVASQNYHKMLRSISFVAYTYAAASRYHKVYHKRK